MKRLYMAPGSCSTGIHILLEEVGEIFEVYIVNIPAGDNRKPEYLAINPKGSVPTLVLDDGEALIDFRSIAIWIGQNYPRRKLLPETEQARQAVLAMLDFATQKIHGEAFVRVFVPENFSTTDAERLLSINEGKALASKYLAQVDKQLQGRKWAAGENYSIADPALFYVEFWATRTDVPLGEDCQRHFKAMLKRMPVRQVMAEEGYVSLL